MKFGLLWAAGALLLVGCTVPSLKDLEAEKKRACDADHACLSGYQCISGFCEVKTSTSGTCSPGATQSCGSDVGDCVPGTQTCQQNGTWSDCTGGVGPVAEVCDGKDNDCDNQTDEEPVTASCGVDVGVCAGKNKACIAGSEEAACTVASFGGEYQTVESVCDGKDNDCDGQTDENLFASCALSDAGVCVGATQACRDGGFGGCSTADYLAHSPRYEPYELSCDNLDNDCDGLTDDWKALIVSESGSGKVRKAVAAVGVPDAGNAVARDLLLFYEDGTRVTMRPFSADGQLGTPVAPAASVTVADKAYAPALTSDSTTMAAAWFDQLNGPPVTYRLQVGLPTPTGQSFIGGNPGAVPVAVLTGPGLTISIAAAGGRIAIAYDYMDQTGTPVPRVAVANCPIALDASCGTRILTTGPSTGQNPTVAIDSGGQFMHVVYEVPGAGLAYQQVQGNSTLSLVNTQTINNGDSTPLVRANGPSLELYTIRTSDNRVIWRQCNFPCNSGLGGQNAVGSAFSGTATHLRIASTPISGVVAIAEVTESVGGISKIEAVPLPSPPGAPFELSDPSKGAFRPIIVTHAKSTTSGSTILWDTEGVGAGGAVTPDVVYARRNCF